MKIKKIWLVCLVLIIVPAAVICMIGPGEGKPKNSDAYASGSIGTQKTPGKNADINEAAYLPYSFENSSTNGTVKNSTQNKSTAQKPKAIQGTETTYNTYKGQASSGKKEEGIQSPPKPEPQITVPKVVDDKANSIARSEVQVGDYIEVLKILQGKLSLSEIKYLFDSASDDYWVKTPVEDIENARRILFSKLLDDNLDKLDQLGRKYGRSMIILKRDIDVTKIKEEEMRKKGLIQ